MRAARIFFLFTGVIAILLTLIPWYSNHLVDNATQAAEAGHQVDSLHAAESAVKYNPYSVKVLFVLADAEQSFGREAEARRLLVRATELQPRNYFTWEQLGLYERDRWGQPVEADAHFRQAIALNPKDEFLASIFIACPDENDAGS